MHDNPLDCRGWAGGGSLAPTFSSGSIRPCAAFVPVQPRDEMISRIFGLSLLLVLAGAPAAAQTLPRVTIQTSEGDIVVEVDTIRAPVTGSNFLRYVDGGFYHGGRFHRTVHLDNQPNDAVKIEVIQGGIARVEGEGFPPIPLERTSVTGLRHLDGVVSMARGGPDTATSDIFICIGDQPGLDFGGDRNPDGQGFAAFGRVLRGMDVVRRIQAAPAEGQALRPPVSIVNIVRVGVERAH